MVQAVIAGQCHNEGILCQPLWPPPLYAQYWLDIVAGYLSRDTARVAGAGAQLLGLLRDMEALAATNRGFILGASLSSRRAVLCSACLHCTG